jgi:sugar/nucleoside kinase (ribokinase family)
MELALRRRTLRFRAPLPTAHGTLVERELVEVVLTAADGTSERWAPAPLPGAAVDAYGAGDCFAAGVTYALGEGRTAREAVDVGARCGAACMTGRGPYSAQLRNTEVA